jgi:hypothetical protein
MCDFSLHGVKNRLAREGESLVVHKFHTGSKGLASQADLEAVRPRGLFKRLMVRMGIIAPSPARFNVPAVCVPPGARLYVEGIPKRIREDFEVGADEEVTFDQITAEAFRYRDGFRFDNGEFALLQCFDEGVRVEVQALALEEETAAVVGIEIRAGISSASACEPEQRLSRATGHQP